MVSTYNSPSYTIKGKIIGANTLEKSNSSKVNVLLNSNYIFKVKSAFQIISKIPEDGILKPTL